MALMAPEAPTIGMVDAGSESDMAPAGHQAGKEIEDQEPAMPHGVLHVVPEDPEEPEVPDEVHPASMEEHGGDQGGPGKPPSATWNPARKESRPPSRSVISAGMVPRVQTESSQGRLREPCPLNQNPQTDTDPHDQEGDQGEDLSGVVVVEGKHGPSVGSGSEGRIG